MNNALYQTLTSTEVGPILVGVSRFILRADPPRLNELPIDEIIIAALVIQVYYNDQEFYRVGYMLNHEMPTDFNEENPDYSSVIRHVSMDPNDITIKLHQIKWN